MYVEPPAQPCVLCDRVLFLLYVMVWRCICRFKWWIVVVVVDVGPCTYISGAIIKLACTGDAAPIVM